MLQQDMKNKEKRQHPNQKPVNLYIWLLNNYAKEGNIILDTHFGSASSIIACIKTGFKYVGIERDEYYFNLGKERVDAELSQMSLFR